MNVSYNWLKKYIDIQLSPEELEDKLTFAGIEVEAVEKTGAQLKQFKIAQITDKEKHPEADKLSVCKVHDGSETLQVVCGAPNCAKDQKIVLAPVGSKIGEMKIKKAKLRGVQSFGMICSESELGISDNHDGIMVLPNDAPVGTDLASYLQLEDTVYEVEITPNRPDLLGTFGIARDLSALLELKITNPEIQLPEASGKTDDAIVIVNEEPELCTRYTARVIKDVNVQDSPDWLKQHLLSIGLRPINNIVDITNFVMMEFGHPLHAFDYNKVEDKKIIIRRAKDKEKFPALDENEYELSVEDLVIADGKKPIALAGIIGGENSHITEDTTGIVLEAANFLYSGIKKSSGRLKIASDSSYRFERDLSDETVELASNRAASLILEIAGGELLAGTSDSYPNPQKHLQVTLRPSRVKHVLAIDVTDQTLVNYLEALGLKLISESEDKLDFEIPSYRKDLYREIDLIEEIIRLHGFNNVKTQLKPQNIMNRELFYARRKMQDILVDYGFSQTMNWSFGDPKDLDKLNIAEDDERRNFAKLKNPLGTDNSIMRSTLLPHLLKNALYNFNHGEKNVRLYESDKVFTRTTEKLAKERYVFAGIISGQTAPIYWKEKAVQTDFYDVKGIIEHLLEDAGIKKFSFVPSEENYLQKGQSADIFFKKKKIGSIGKIDTKTARTFDIEVPIYFFELLFDEIMNSERKTIPQFQVIPKFPPVLRDISFLISDEYFLESIRKTIFAANPGVISKVVLFDEYKGKNIKAGYRSLTFSLSFSSVNKTLNDEFVNNLFTKIVKKLQNEFNIEMR